LYIVWAGANNFFDPANLTPDGIAQAVPELISAVGTLHAYGARHIVLGNLPDLGITPDGLVSGMGPLLTGFSEQFNGALQGALGLSGLDVILFDAFTSFQNVAADPSAFGLTNVTDACFDGTQVIGNPDDYLFWDSVHPTTKGHQVLSDIVFQQLVALEPLNLNDTAIVDVTVSDVHTPVAFVDDNLYIGGTSRADAIYVSHDRGAKIRAYVNGNRMGPFRLDRDARVVIVGHEGNDWIHAGQLRRSTIIAGGPGHDFLFGSRESDILWGGAGNDFLFGRGGDDVLYGGKGRDFLFGGSGNDLLRGGRGNDFLFGGWGDDVLVGGPGRDWLFGEMGDDELDGGKGVDWLFGGLGNDVLKNGEWNFS
jgi:hypothetical protein